MFQRCLQSFDEYAYVSIDEHQFVENLKDMATKYVSPTAVVSPKAHWSLIAVLDDAGPSGVALAVGRWDQNPTLAMRWNGDDEINPIGNPQSRGLPTWFVLPEGAYSEAIIALLPADKQTLVRNFIPKPAQ
jgi:hypothetical protein